MKGEKEKGFVLFIIGASGSGKTSLLNELAKRGFIEPTLKFADREKRNKDDDIEHFSAGRFMEDAPFYYQMNNQFYAFEPFALFKEVSKGKRKGMILSNTLTIKNIKGMARQTGYDIDFKVIAIEHDLKKENVLPNRNDPASRLRSFAHIQEDIETKRNLDKKFLQGKISFDDVRRFSPIDYIFQKQESVEKLADMVIAELKDDALTLEEKLILKRIKTKNQRLI